MRRIGKDHHLGVTGKMGGTYSTRLNLRLTLGRDIDTGRVNSELPKVNPSLWG